MICIFITAPTAGGPAGQLAAGAAAVPGQIGLLPPQQPTIGQQQLELPSTFDISSTINILKDPLVFLEMKICPLLLVCYCNTFCMSSFFAFIKNLSQ